MSEAEPKLTPEQEIMQDSRDREEMFARHEAELIETAVSPKDIMHEDALVEDDYVNADLEDDKIRAELHEEGIKKGIVGNNG